MTTVVGRTESTDEAFERGYEAAKRDAAGKVRACKPDYSCPATTDCASVWITMEFAAKKIEALSPDKREGE